MRNHYQRIYRESLRDIEACLRIRCRAPETGRPLVFLTNRFDLPARTVAELYKVRWRIELFL